MVEKYTKLTDSGEIIIVHLIWKDGELSEIRRLREKGGNKFKESYYKEEKSEYFEKALKEEIEFLGKMTILRGKLLANS